MNRREFNQYLSECNFRELFIMEMGWNRFRAKADIWPINVDGVDYAILKEVKNVGTTYVFLSNVANSEDMMIRKSVNDEDYVPLDGDKEFELACLLLFK